MAHRSGWLRLALSNMFLNTELQSRGCSEGPGQAWGSSWLTRLLKLHCGVGAQLRVRSMCELWLLPAEPANQPNTTNQTTVFPNPRLQGIVTVNPLSPVPLIPLRLVGDSEIYSVSDVAFIF